MTEDATGAEKIVPFAVPPVVKSVSVKCSAEQAFHLFTDHIAAWWPLAFAHRSADPETCVFETRLGGRVYERDKSGAEVVWGEVLVWEPPTRFVMSWVDYRLPEHVQRVEVTFRPQGAGAVVDLTHSGWETLGDAALERRTGYDNGWARVFEQGFADYANALA